MGKAGLVLTLAAGMVCPAAAMAQSTWQPGPHGIGFGKPRSKQWVQLISSPEITVKAAAQAWKPANIELRFAIQDGLHINSHTPDSHFLIPTSLALDKTSGMQIAGIEYPKGVEYHFQFSSTEALSVYTGEFDVRVRARAHSGHYTLRGHLHYQACDDRACNPPQTLPFHLDIIAR